MSLVINRYLMPNTVVVDFDFSKLTQLVRDIDHPNKGFKERIFWVATDDGKIAVEILQSIVDYKDRKAIKRVINWYNEKGEVKEVKEKIHRVFTTSSFKTFQRKLRSQAIDYLEAKAEENGQGFLIELITHVFKTELDHFILSGSNEFKYALENELTNENSQVVELGNGVQLTLSQILSQKLPPTDKYPNGQTVLEGIIEEIM